LSIIVFAFYIGGPESGMIKGLMFFLATVWAILPGFLGIESVTGMIIFAFLLVVATSTFAGWYSIRTKRNR
jgi:hypothetical protein